jgi:hypothetical protein
VPVTGVKYLLQPVNTKHVTRQKRIERFMTVGLSVIAIKATRANALSANRQSVIISG